MPYPLQGGRGPKQDQQAQNEFYSMRREPFKAPPLWYANHSPVTNINTNFIPSNSVTTIVPMPYVDRPTLLSHCSFLEVTSSSGEELFIQLYVADFAGGQLLPIGASFMRADFGASTGNKIEKCRGEFLLPPSAHVFCGVWRETAIGSPAIGGISSTNNTIFPVFEAPIARRDTRISLASLAPKFNRKVPAILFLSQDGAGLVS